MKYSIHEIFFSKVSLGWIIELEVRFPTCNQSTWETRRFSSEGLKLNLFHSAILTFIKFWLLVRKEIKTRQNNSLN